MRKHKIPCKRGFSLFLALTMCVGLLQLPVSAAEGYTGGPCEHHTEHTADCGYVEAVEGVACTHVHDTACGYAAAEAEVPCDKACTDIDGDGVIDHAEDCAYRAAVKNSPCTHEHNAECGYVKAVAGHDCEFVCEICSRNSTSAPETCTCRTQCTADQVNADCPVCGAEGADLEQCTGTPRCQKHTWGEWYTTKEPTCSEFGSQERVCSVCGEKGSGSMMPLPHTWTEWTVTKEATAEELGEKVRTCKVCGAEDTVKFALGSDEEGVFVAEKEATYTYKIYGKGEFTGSFLLNGEEASFETLGYGAIEKVIFAEGVTGIGKQAFSHHNCMNTLKEVVLPSTLTRIEEKAFYSCSNLRSINLEHVTSVGKSAFSGANKLEEITISPAMTEIGEYAFESMRGLKKVVLPEGVRSIGANAFLMCAALESVVLPESLETIGEDAFSNCTQLKTIGQEEGKAHIDGVNRIESYAFEGCSALKDLKITNVEAIEPWAFCFTGVQKISIEDVDAIGDYTFYGSESLKEITLENVDQIGMCIISGIWGENGEYWYENGPESLRVKNVKTISNYAFQRCENLKTISLENVEIVGQDAFFQCFALEHADLTKVGSLYPFVFEATALKSVAMNGVEIINRNAFWGCDQLETITGLNTVGLIDGFAFFGCSSLKGLTVDDLTKMGFNGDNYADVMDRVQAILDGKFSLDEAETIVELTPETGWNSRVGKSENWNTYDHGTQLMEQARWTDAASSVAEVKTDAYYTAKQQMDYIFVVDLSASMAQLGNREDRNARFYDMQSKMLDMTEKLLTTPGYDCQVAIVTFGGTVLAPDGVTIQTQGTSQVIPFNTDKDAVMAEIKALVPLNENTDYGLGLNNVLQLAQGNKNRNTAVIFMSDGQPVIDGTTQLTQGTLPAYREKIAGMAAEIEALGIDIYGVLHSVSAKEHEGAVAAMEAVCSDGLFFEATNTKEFSESVNAAMSAANGGNYTVTIPVGANFSNVTDLQVSDGGGEAVLSADGRTITWTITGMPFTRHTLTYRMTPNAYGTLDVNGGNAVLSSDDTQVNSVETPQLTRTQAPRTHTLTVRYQYTNGTQAAAAVTRTLTEGASYSITSPSISGYSPNRAAVSGVMGSTDLLITVTYSSTGGGGTTPGGGGGGGGGRPGTNPTNPGNTTTIGDTEVPLAGDLQLNKTDHFAYIKGYQDGTVRPNNPITRAQVATIFYRLLDETSRVIYFQETNDFTDVTNDYWANKAISTLTNAGIITGFSDGTFRPNAYITRAQFAAIAARFDNVVPGLNNPFTDVAEDYWARDLIAFAADRGWITGNGGKFRPLENITRVEVMDFINNVLERHVDEQGLLENAAKWSDVPVTDPNYYVVEEATNSHDYTRRTEGQLMENWTQLNPDPVWDE